MCATKAHQQIKGFCEREETPSKRFSSLENSAACADYYIGQNCALVHFLVPNKSSEHHARGYRLNGKQGCADPLL